VTDLIVVVAAGATGLAREFSVPQRTYDAVQEGRTRVRALPGWGGHKPWTSSDDAAGKWFIISVDTQLLLGLLLYFALSPLTRAGLADFAAAMRPPLATRTVPLIELAEISPLMSDTRIDPEIELIVSLVPAGAATV